jgi:DNA-binding LacI/PurR family transcriptional regulator
MRSGTNRAVQHEARPSIRDVADRAGVSVASVSNVINGRRRRDDPIGKAVLSAVEALGYRANPIAANLRRSHSRFIGVIIPDFENPFFAALVAELERCAEDGGYRIVAASSRERADIERREIDALLDWRVAGMVIAPAVGSAGADGAMLRSGVAAVVVDRVPAGCAVDSVAVDNAGAAQAVAGRLLAGGARRLLVACTDAGVGNIAERLAGVRAAIAGVPGARADLVACGMTLDGARAAIAAALDRTGRPDAIFCLFNTATLAAFGILQGRGLVPGRDVALAGFDDSPWMGEVRPPVPAVVQPVAGIARAAWARLMARIDGAGAPAEAVRLPCVVDWRGMA